VVALQQLPRSTNTIIWGKDDVLLLRLQQVSEPEWCFINRCASARAGPAAVVANKHGASTAVSLGLSLNGSRGPEPPRPQKTPSETKPTCVC
jgi:hypothetical protein